jgi:hypothetical protein
MPWTCAGLLGRKQRANVLYFTFDARLLVVDVATLDCPDRLNPADGCVHGSQKLETLTIYQKPPYSDVVAFDQVVSPFPADMSDAIKMRIVW